MGDEYRAREAYQQEQIARKYDAQRFRSLRGQMVDSLEKWALRRALACVSAAGAHVLDLPCGTGRIMALLPPWGYRVTGGDISLSMMRVARTRLHSLDRVIGFCNLEGERLPFSDGAFEGVTSVRLMGHVPPAIRRQILAEMARVSRHWVVVTYYLSNPATDLKRGLKRWYREGRSPWHPVRSEVLQREVAAAGLQIAGCFSVCRYVSEATVYLLKKVG